VKGTSLFGDSIHLRLETQKKFDEVLQGLRETGNVEVDTREIPPSLEDMFISLAQSHEGTYDS
jgi:hypothetical protein